MSKDNILCLKATSLKCCFNVVNEISGMQSLTSPSQPPQRSMCSALFDVKRLWAAFQLTVCYSDCDSRAPQVSLPSLSSQNTDVCHITVRQTAARNGFMWLQRNGFWFNPLLLHQKALKSLQNIHFLVHGVGWAHSTWRALEFTSQKWPL